jgi:predicted site-specific integrase-resolvase
MVRVYKYDQILTEIVSFFNDRMKETQGLIKMFSEKEDLRSMEYYTGQLRAFCQGFYFVNYKRGPKKDLWSKEDKGTNHDC